MYTAVIRHYVGGESIYGGRQPLTSVYLPTQAVARTGPFTGPFDPGVAVIPVTVRRAVTRRVEADVSWVTGQSEVPFPLGYAEPGCSRRRATDAVVLRLTPVPAGGDAVEVGLSGMGSCGVAGGVDYRLEATAGCWRVTHSQTDWIT